MIFASEESLKKINQKILSKYGKEELKKQGLDDGLSMDRFRASFSVSLGDNPSAKNAHFEDKIKKFRLVKKGKIVEDLVFHVNRPRDCCVMTKNDPSKGMRLRECKEPYKTLGDYRSGKILGIDKKYNRKDWTKLVFFGVFVVPEFLGEKKSVIFNVGDELLPF